MMPPTTRSSSLGWVSAFDRQTAKQYSKMGITKARKQLSRSNIWLNTCQNFQKIASLSEDAYEMSSKNQTSLPIGYGPQTPSGQYHQELTGVTGDAPGAYHSLNFTHILLHPQRSHHTLTLESSRFSGVISITIKAPMCKKVAMCTGGAITGPKHFPAVLQTQR